MFTLNSCRVAFSYYDWNQRDYIAYADFLSNLDFDVQFELLEMELSRGLVFIRPRSHGTIVPKGQKPTGSEGNREIFIVKKAQPSAQARTFRQDKFVLQDDA